MNQKQKPRLLVPFRVASLMCAYCATEVAVSGYLTQSDVDMLLDHMLLWHLNKVHAKSNLDPFDPFA